MKLRHTSILTVCVLILEARRIAARGLTDHYWAFVAVILIIFQIIVEVVESGAHELQSPADQISAIFCIGATVAVF